MDYSPLSISMKVAVVSTIVTFFIGILAAWYVMKLHRLKAVADSILILPMILPPTVTGFFLLLLFGKNGLLGQFLARIHLSIVFTWQGAVIAAAVVSFPLMYRTARGAFEQLDPNLIYAARTLGVPESKIFWRIILPNCWPGIAAGIVLSFARALGEFGATTMLAGNIPGKTQTMSLAIYSAVAGNNREKAYQWVAIILALSFITLILANLFSKPRLYQKKTPKKRVA